MSISAGPFPLIGVSTPGKSRTGRRLMYWWNANRSRSKIPFSRMPGATPGMPDRAEVDRVAAAEVFEHRVGQHLAGPEVPLAAEVELDQFRAKVVEPRHIAQDRQPFADDLGTHTIPRDHTDRRQRRLRPSSRSPNHRPARRRLRKSIRISSQIAGWYRL